MTKKIYLVNAANDEGISSITNDYTYPALGVLSLATWLEHTLPPEDVEIMREDVLVIKRGVSFVICS